MPVSPQDFALWSRMTGNPYPQTPAERMALAPHVYDYTRQIGRQGGPTMGPVRRAVDVIGKAALLAGGLAGAAYLLGGPPPPPPGGGGAMSMSAPSKGKAVEEVAEEAAEKSTPIEIAEVEGPTVESVRFAREKARGMSRAESISQQEKKSSLRRASARFGPEVMGAEPPIPGAADPYAMREVMAHLSRQGLITPPTTTAVIPTSFGKLGLDNEPGIGSTVVEAMPDVTSQAARNSGDVTPATTSQRFGQSVIPDQTSVVQAVKGTNAAKPTLGTIEQKPVTQSELIATGQHFSPGNELEQASTRAVEATGASPIAAMSKVSNRPYGASAAEVYELDTLLKRTHGRHSQEERDSIRNQLLSQKYPSQSVEVIPQSGASVPAPSSTPSKVITARPSYPVRVSEEVVAPAAKVSANEFLSEMSQQVGPIATYKIPSQRSSAVRGISFYPGGEVGIHRRGGQEYVYGVSDPMRLALSDYAEEGFPSGMGNVGRILDPAGLSGGLQKLSPGGTSSEDQPARLGLMDPREIAKKLASKSKRTREQAAYHAEVREDLENFAQRNPQPPLSPIEKQQRIDEIASYRAAAKQKYGI